MVDQIQKEGLAPRVDSPSGPDAGGSIAATVRDDAAVRSEVAAGAVFCVPYPFVVETYEEPIADEDGFGSVERKTWRPGVRFEPCGQYGECTDCVADAMGVMELRVVSTHKPGRYPERVFYVRTWRDPDGKPFGKLKLRMTTVGAFRTLRSGYRHRIESLTGAGRE
jgi:hypothetical protein